MTRAVAFALFAAAAFDVGVPWLDRVGTAALAFGFLALAAGRVSTARLPAMPSLGRVRAHDFPPADEYEPGDGRTRLVPQ